MVKDYVKFRIFGAFIAAVIVAIDLFTKRVALTHLNLYQPVPVIDGFLNWTLAFNRGVSFSMLGDVALESLPEILGIFALVMGVVFIHWLGQHKDRLSYVLGLALIAGGALGNGIDRLLRDAVVDFINIYYDKWHFPTFNVADIAITIGVIFILIDAYLETMTANNEKEEK